MQVPEEAPAELDLLIQQCLEKDVSRRPNAKQVYSSMMTILQGEGGLPDEPVRVVNTDPRAFRSGRSSNEHSMTTDSTYDSVGSKPPSSIGNSMTTLT